MIVFSQVVESVDWCIDTPTVETRDVAFVLANVTAKQIDFLLALAAVLTVEKAAGRNADRIEAEGVGADRGQQLVVEPDGVKVGDSLISGDRRGFVHAVGERACNGTSEKVGPRRIEDPDEVVRRGRDVRIEVIPDVTQFARAQIVDIKGRAQET